VATASIAALGESASWTVLELWWGRNLAGALLVAGSGHLLLHALVTGVRVPPPLRRLPELLLVVAAGLASFVLIDLERGQPLAFLLIATSVWCALRFDTVVAALQVVVSGATAFALIVAGQGPFVRSPDPVDALTMQAFVITLLVITLAIGSSRDQRVAALAELDEARRDAAERARHLETVTEVMGEGLTVLDVDANLVRMNSAARAILDMTPAGTTAPTAARDYVVCSPDGSVLDPVQHPSVRAITEGRVGPEDLLLVMDDGSRRTLSVTADMLAEDGRSVGSVVVFHDVTEERRQTDQLAEFAATAAHDLRSPLTALRGWIELAAESSADPASERVLLRAREAAVRMQELITDLLEQASAEGGLLSAAELEAVPLDLAVDDVARYLPQDAVLTREAELPVVSAHPEMLRQLLTNLLGNAVKYVEPGVTPQVAVTARRLGDRVEVAVADNGIGIPDEERTRVFERLHRAHADDRRYDGTGLGLAICRTIVVRHGGHIECRPAPGGGTVFAFDLPAAVPDLPIVAPPVGEGAVVDEA
jgi:signal transduction histidine kinase